jgi:5-methylcytosine-specific restriction endonuclease McrA
MYAYEDYYDGPVPMDVDSDTPHNALTSSNTEYNRDIVESIGASSETALVVFSHSSSISKNKTRKDTISKTIRNKIWTTYIGTDRGIGTCFCCGDEISVFKYECGHVISEFNGGHVSIENLRPICSLCNKSMGKTNMTEFMIKNGLKQPPNWFGIHTQPAKLNVIEIID